MQSVSENSETPPSVPVQAVQQQLLGAIQKLVEQVEKLEMKPPHDHEQYMRLPRKFQEQGAGRQGWSVTCYRCGGRAIILGNMQPQGTPVRTVQVEVEMYTRLNNIRTLLTNFQSVMFPVMCCLVVCTLLQCPA